MIHHDAPQVAAVARPQLPFVLGAGQTLAVQLDEAVGGPELPSPKELKDHPELSSAVNTSVLRYTWTRRTVYRKQSELVGDLGAPRLAGRFA